MTHTSSGVMCGTTATYVTSWLASALPSTGTYLPGGIKLQMEPRNDRQELRVGSWWFHPQV
ncbi:unnamed protein product [Discosporangium mesarthrocarpum]